jgi:CRP-like cAMP-binding protein
LRRIPLLHSLNCGEAKTLVCDGNLIRAKKGGTIVSVGQRSCEVFVAQRGEVAVKANNLTVATLGSGTIFGETALITSAPRTADVIAETDIETLGLTKGFLRKAMRAMPDIMVRVLFNLSMILTERLAARARQLGGATVAKAANKTDAPAPPAAKLKAKSKPAAA